MEGSLKTNPLAIVFGGVPLGSEYRLAYELMTGSKQSQMISFSAIRITPLIPIYQNQNSGRDLRFILKGFRFQYMYRYFFRKWDKAPEGWYTGPVFSYATGRLSIHNYLIRQRYIEFHNGYFCMAIGNQRKLFGRVVSDMFFGLGYKQNRINEHFTSGALQPFKLGDDEFVQYYLSPVKICFGWNIGFLF